MIIQRQFYFCSSSVIDLVFPSSDIRCPDSSFVIGSFALLLRWCLAIMVLVDPDLVQIQVFCYSTFQILLQFLNFQWLLPRRPYLFGYKAGNCSFQKHSFSKTFSKICFVFSSLNFLLSMSGGRSFACGLSWLFFIYNLQFVVMTFLEYFSRPQGYKKSCSTQLSMKFSC